VHDAATTTTGSASARIGRVAGPLAALGLYLVLPGLDDAPRLTAAVTAWMAVWWMTEAVPLPITSLLPIVAFPLLGVQDITATTRPYANEIIFLFAGGFVLAQAVQRWDLHQRVALWTVTLVGTGARRLIGGFMLATGFVSMWVSNTATAVMMLPIAMSVLALVEANSDPEGDNPLASVEWGSFGTALMLAVAYAASIGSVATIIGTPPNGILAGYMAQQGTPIGFGQWMVLGVPMAAVFGVLAWLLLTRIIFRVRAGELPGGAEVVHEELRRMGTLSRGERLTLAVFLGAAALWIGRQWLQDLPGLAGLTDSSIAIAAAIVLFLLPVDRRAGVMVLDWEHARRIPWGILVLFGGGLSLASAIESSGLGAAIGARLLALGHLPLVVLVVATALVVVFLTEVTSNTATTAVFVPILAGGAISLGLDPLQLALPATLVATFAFMLPVATPPNAIVFGSGRISVGQMARAGVLLNLVGVILTAAVMFSLAPLVFGL
jgi:solute carrier family 13 (sodium-dependent dicarboxylate transporter), member 2/3/5